MKEKREGDDTGGRRERMKGEASGGNEGELDFCEGERGLME